MTKTVTVKNEEVKRDWYIIDAVDVRLGKLATAVARILQGKNKASVSGNVDVGDFVVVINSKRIDVHPSRLEKKMYYNHSGYPGGLNEEKYEDLSKRKPNEIIKRAVKGMLPSNKLRSGRLNRLFIYESENHQHAAQKPKLFEIK